MFFRAAGIVPEGCKWTGKPGATGNMPWASSFTEGAS